MTESVAFNMLYIDQHALRSRCLQQPKNQNCMAFGQLSERNLYFFLFFGISNSIETPPKIYRITDILCFSFICSALSHVRFA